MLPLILHMPTVRVVGKGKKERIMWYMELPEQVAPQTCSSCLENHWPCAGGLSAVNVLRTQLRDLMKRGTGPMAFGGRCDTVVEGGSKKMNTRSSTICLD